MRHLTRWATLFILTPGQSSEYKQATPLITGFQAAYIIADRGYDSDCFVAEIEANSAIPVIPPRRHHKLQGDYDTVIYKERNLVERVFLKLKNYRRIATRYERLA